MAAGEGTTFIVSPGGELLGGGANGSGQLGDGTLTTRTSRVSIAQDVDRVASAGRSTFFLKRDGTLWGMGANESGALGASNVTFLSRPVQVATDVIGFAVTPEELFYITADQTLWGQGRNRHGVLGNGTTSPSWIPIRIAGEVRGVESNGLQMFYWNLSGQLHACGNNLHGGLGDGTTTNRLSPVMIRHTTSAISIWGRTTFSVDSNGKVFSWGESRSDAGITREVSTSPRQILAIGEFTTLSGDFGLRRNGDLWALRDQYLVTTSPPWWERVAEGVVGFASSGNHLVFMDRDGFIYTKGLNTSGELGAGNTSVYPDSYGFIQGTRYALPSNDLAPASLLGRTAHVFISSGSGLFSSSGSYRISLEATGSRYSVTPVTGDVSPTVGTYTYQKTGGSTATLSLTDSVVGAAGSNRLTFFAPNYATYSVTGTGGSQAGSLYLQETPIIYPMIRSRTVASGTVVNWFANVRGVPTISYRWFRNGVQLSGESTSRLVEGPYRENTRQPVDGTRYYFEVSNQAGGVRSDEVTLTIVPRALSGGQSAVNVSPGSRAQLTPRFPHRSGLTTSYQWFRDGAPIEGATHESLTIEQATTASAGAYYLIFGDEATAGWVKMDVAVISTPVIQDQPQAFSASIGQSASFSVAAIGSGLAYQWRRNGTPIAGATDSSMVIARVASADAGSYTVAVSNPSGSAVSQAAALSVLSSPASRIMNLSILAALEASETMTLGTVTRGSTAGKRMLFRAAGPALAQFGIRDFAVDPTLRVYRASALVTENDDWGGATALAATFRAVGAFAYPSLQSLDSAIFGERFVAPSAYTAEIREFQGRAGSVLAEIYDATPTPNEGLVNVSVLKRVPAGATLTAGFVIGGPGVATKRVLIRAVGPRLAFSPFNIGGVMADPSLAVFRGQTEVASNDNWGIQSGGVSVATIRSTFTSVGAFEIADAASKDAVLLLNLAPGAYTAVVSGANQSAGLAIVEVYEVP
jgi:hypothetical protein